MVSNVLCFCGVVIMSFCVGRMLPDEMLQLNNKKRWIIVYAFGLIMFILLFKMKLLIKLAAGLILAILVTGIDYGLEKYLPF